MSAHTPGPWRAVKRAGSYTSPFVIVDGSGSGIANLEGNQLNPTGTSIGAAEANASLIAAAPELLEALRNLLDLTWPSLDMGEQSVIDLARAAIAKAEGK